MDSFSISQISQFSGIKPNTIRAWERRYNVVEPNRSKGNTRYYSNAQLRRLLNIAGLKDEYKVSSLCLMSDEELFDLVERKLEKEITPEPDEYFISQLISAGIHYDETHFGKIFSHCLLRYGMKDAYIKVVQPMLVRLGLMWASNRLPPPQEHFISNLIRQKLMTAIDSLPPAKQTADVWLLFLPEDEFHDIGLLLAHYLIRLSGKKVIFLGANIPMESLTSAAEETKPDYLLLFLIRNDLPENTQGYLAQLSASLPEVKLFLSGNDELIGQLELAKEVQWLKSVKELDKKLKR